MEVETLTHELAIANTLRSRKMQRPRNPPRARKNRTTIADLEGRCLKDRLPRARPILQELLQALVGQGMLEQVGEGGWRDGHHVGADDGRVLDVGGVADR